MARLFMTAAGKHYTAANAASGSDQEELLPDPDYITAITGLGATSSAAAVDPNASATRSAHISTKRSNGHIAATTGWIIGLALVVSLSLLAQPAVAQTPAIQGCQPANVPPQAAPCPAPPTTQIGGTIAITNTFQVALAANTTPNAAGGSGTRQACIVQNNGTHNMFVYFKKTGGPAATLTAAIVLAPGLNLYCQNTAGQVLQDEIDITGTATETYSIAYQ